jgi:putative phage-type endonuclease
MKNGAEWLIVDTETDGLMDPIHVVEIAAQRMRGWEPVGEKFRVLLNHNVHIPSAAVAIHGYTEEFLRKNGEEPLRAHANFRDFAGDLPVVAHNLSFDWNRALYPEWGRLGLAPVGRRGFCSLMLSRRVVDETKSYRLDALRGVFGISGDYAHRAFGDVDTMVALFGRVFRPRLEGAGVHSFEQVAEFACKTPVAKCLCSMKSKATKSERTRSAEPDESWYFIDGCNQTHGPLPAEEIVALMRGMPCWVWKEGMADWVSSESSPEFLLSLRKARPSAVQRKGNTQRAAAPSMAELQEVCRGIIADGVVTTEEVVCLSKWLEDAGVMVEWPGTEIAATVERIIADGVVTDDERKELLSLLQRVDGSFKAGEASKVSRRGTETNTAQTTTKVELTCVGNAGGGYINAQIRVLWFEVLVDEARRAVDVIEHYLPIKSHRREKRVNFCEYEVPEGVVCFYERHVSTEPNVNESKYFRIEDGAFQDLGVGAQCDFCSRFLSEHASYDICSGRTREEVHENRVRRAETDKLPAGVYIMRRSVPDVTEDGARATSESSAVRHDAESFDASRLQSYAATVLQFTQGTAEWLEWRNKGIGASDAPTIMGENPWKTITELLLEKRGRARRSEGNAAMARGTALEPEARQAYISQTGKWVEPACLQSGAYEWLRASVDGITPELDAVVEIKCGESVYRNTAANGCVPDHYYGQLQHILAVTGLPLIDFWCYLPGCPTVLVPVERDDGYIGRLLEAEFKFWAEVQRRG